ncbi:MAG: response regulator transcription factor, partial [Fibrobacterota bacterium]
ADGEAAVALIFKHKPDLIILDLMLPKKDGYQVCRTVRENGVHSFILMLTAKKEEMDRVMGFNAGTDDYMIKPFSLMELLAKIKAVFRRIRQEKPESENFEMGWLLVDFKKYEVRKKGELLEFSAKEFEILRHFLMHPGDVVSRDDLLDKVWGYEVYPSTRTIDNFIVRLRQKLEADPENPELIRSIRGVGYKFCPEALK